MCGPSFGPGDTIQPLYISDFSVVYRVMQHYRHLAVMISLF
jgi:hypothetical protein